MIHSDSMMVVTTGMTGQMIPMIPKMTRPVPLS